MRLLGQFQTFCFFHDKILQVQKSAKRHSDNSVF